MRGRVDHRRVVVAQRLEQGRAGRGLAVKTRIEVAQLRAHVLLDGLGHVAPAVIGGVGAPSVGRATVRASSQRVNARQTRYGILLLEPYASSRQSSNASRSQPRQRSRGPLVSGRGRVGPPTISTYSWGGLRRRAANGGCRSSPFSLPEASETATEHRGRPSHGDERVAATSERSSVLRGSSAAIKYVQPTDSGSPRSGVRGPFDDASQRLGSSNSPRPLGRACGR